MSTIKISELANGTITLQSLLAFANTNGVAFKGNVEELNAFINTLAVLGLKGAISASDTSPTEDGLYPCQDTGIYTNFGGLAVDVSDTVTFISVSETQTVFKLVEVPVGIVKDATPIEGSVNSVESGGVFNYVGLKLQNDNWLNKTIPISYTELNKSFVQQGIDSVIGLNLNIPTALSTHEFEFEILCADSSTHASLSGFAYSLVIKDVDANKRYKLEGVSNEDKENVSFLSTTFSDGVKISAVIDWYNLPTQYAMFGESRARALANTPNLLVRRYEQINERFLSVEKNDNWLNKDLGISYTELNKSFVQQGIDSIVNLEVITPDYMDGNTWSFEILCADSSTHASLSGFAYSLSIKNNTTNKRYTTSVALDYEKDNISLLSGVFIDSVEIYCTIDWSKLPSNYAMFGESSAKVLTNIISPNKSISKEVMTQKPYPKKVLWTGTSIPEGSSYPRESCRRNGFNLYNKALGSSGIVVSTTNFKQIGGRAGKDLTETVAEKTSRYTNDVEIDEIYINSSASSDGVINYTLDGVPYSANVLNGDTASEIATKIRAVSVPDWNVSGSGTEIIFTATQTGIRDYPTVSNTAGISTSNTPTQIGTYYSQEDLDNIYSWSFENRLIPYIDGTIDDCDVLVFDHAHNDKDSINNEIANINSLDWTLTDVGVDRTTWNGAFRYLITKILKVNPQIKIVIAGMFEGVSNAPDENNNYFDKSGKNMADMHTYLANKFGFKLIETWKDSGCSVQYIPGTSNYISDFNLKYNKSYLKISPDSNGNITSYQICCPDGVHPDRDLSNKFNKTLNNIFTEGLKSL